MSTTSEVYVLVTLSNATLTSFPTSNGPTTFTGKLALECVTFNILRTRTTSTPITPTRDVLLVLRLGAFEAPLDPARALTVSVLPPSGARRYVFHATQDDAKFTVDLPPEMPENVEAVELFHSVLVGYTTDARGLGDAPARGADHNASAPAAEGTGLGEDLRGRFVLMNEDNGEVVGALDGSVRVHEDPSLGERGHENDPVVVELPEDADMLDSEVLVRAIPPEERDWLVKGAVFVSHAISGTTTLLTSAMTSASNYYIAHTTPGAPSPTPPSSSSASPARASRSESSHTLLLLQSSTTRKHLTSIHAVSGSAVKLSNKAAAAVDSWIQRAAGTSTAKDKGKGKPQSTLSPSQPLGTAADRKSPPPQLPPRSRSRSRSPALPAAYPPDTKPPLPARNNKSSLSPSPSPSRTPSPSPSQSTGPTPPPLSMRVALSASLVLSSLAESSVRLVDAGGAAVSAAVAHKYGAAAGENVALAAGTVRNVVLVYVDVRGLGRRVIVKRTAERWVKGRVVKAREGAAPRK